MKNGSTIDIAFLDKSKDEILAEIWENAIFNDEIYDLLEKIILIADANHTNAKDASFLETQIKDILFELTTIRNRNLISHSSQEKLQNTVVGFFGLSVGSHAAITWMMESRADHVKIADPDTIAASNLNRLRLGWQSIGESKVSVVEKELIHINPYTTISTLKSAEPDDEIKFLNQNPPLQIIVDAIDDMKAKIMLRKFAKTHRIPLVSAADVGDNVMLDIERYDLDPQPEMFLGKVPGIEKINFDDLSDIERKKMIIKLIGFDHNSNDMLDSLLNIGKTIGTWPQLGATATIAGGVIVTTIKKIMLKENVVSGRYFVSLDDLLVQDFMQKDKVEEREIKIRKIKSSLHLEE